MTSPSPSPLEGESDRIPEEGALADGDGTMSASPPAPLAPGEKRVGNDTHSRRLWHCWKDGRARFNGYLDDYAGILEGLVELSQATFDPRYLRHACEFAETLIAQFHDSVSGGFFYTSTDHETLIARQKEIHDNATPSGNSLAATALLKLSRLTGRRDLEAVAVETLEMMSGTLSRLPAAAGQALIALDFLIGPAEECVLIDGGDTIVGDNAIASVRHRFVPNKVVWRHAAAAPVPAVLASLLTGKTAWNGETSLYICREGTCQSPVTGIVEIDRAIEAL